MKLLSKIVASAAITSSLCATTALAANYNASVDILVALSQSESTELNFGRFAKPGAGKTLTVDVQSADGTTTIGGDAADQTQYGSVAVGVIAITGDTQEDVDITYAAGNTASNGLLLSELNCKYGGASQVDVTGTDDITINDGAAPSLSTELKVAGKLTIDENVATGVGKTFAYTITLAYD